MSCDRTHGPDVTRITHLSRKAIKRISSLWALGTGGQSLRQSGAPHSRLMARPRREGRVCVGVQTSVLLRFRWDFDFEFSTSLEVLRPLRRQGIPARAPRRRAG